MSVVLHNVCRALQIKNVTLLGTSCQCTVAACGFEPVTELQLCRHSTGRGRAPFHTARQAGYLAPKRSYQARGTPASIPEERFRVPEPRPATLASKTCTVFTEQ